MAKQQVAFLRAVNVGKRRVAMADLRRELEGIGLDDVWTHINSGNAVFRSPLGRAKLEARIEACLLDSFGFEVETFVRTAAQVAEVRRQRPAPTRGCSGRRHSTGAATRQRGCHPIGHRGLSDCPSRG